MKTTLFAFAAAIALSSLSVAHAADPTVQIRPVSTTSGYYLTPEQFLEFANHYQLSTGQKISFNKSGTRFYLQLNKGKEVRIRPVAANEFVTDAGTRISFVDGADTVRIANFERLPLAGDLPANTIVMASR